MTSVDLQKLEGEPALFMPSPRIDPAFRDPAIYPKQIDIPVRYQDLDPNGHVNNAAFGIIAEDVRVQTYRSLDFDPRSEGGRNLVVSVQLDYLAEAFWGAPINFHTGFGYIGTSSWRQVALGLQEGRPVLLNSSTIVFAKGDGPAPIPESFREKLEKLQVRC